MATQRIFISYRRRDSGPVVERLFDVLATVFGAEHVFRDVSSVDAGVRFDTAVERSPPSSQWWRGDSMSRQFSSQGYGNW